MQEETEVLGENPRGRVWIENQIHIRLWPDWESNPGRIGKRHGNNRCANPTSLYTREGQNVPATYLYLSKYVKYDKDNIEYIKSEHLSVRIYNMINIARLVA